MRVSQFLRQWQLTSEVPDVKEAGEPDAQLAFWAGYLLGGSATATNFDDRRAMAIKAAEFIEERAK